MNIKLIAAFSIGLLVGIVVSNIFCASSPFGADAAQKNLQNGKSANVLPSTDQPKPVMPEKK